MMLQLMMTMMILNCLLDYHLRDRQVDEDEEEVEEENVLVMLEQMLNSQMKE